MKALVTGGAGFIGSHLVERLVKKNVEVTVVDDLSMGMKENLSGLPNVHFFKEDVCNYRFMHELVKNEEFDYIFYLAAVASVADSVARPLETHMVNNESVLNLLDFIKDNGIHIKRFLYTSSAAVYGDLPDLPKTENSNVFPMSPYAIDKYASERYVSIFSELYGLPTVCVRFFNVYGPRQNPNSPYSGVLSIITNCLSKRNTFTMYGDGTQTRDFIYVDDVINALMRVVSVGRSGAVYNVANGEETSLNTLISEYELVTKQKLKIDYKSFRKGDIKRSVSDISKLLNLGYKKRWDLKSGLKKYWDFSQEEKDETNGIK